MQYFHMGRMNNWRGDDSMRGEEALDFASGGGSHLSPSPTLWADGRRGTGDGRLAEKEGRRNERGVGGMQRSIIVVNVGVFIIVDAGVGIGLGGACGQLAGGGAVACAVRLRGRAAWTRENGGGTISTVAPDGSHRNADVGDVIA